MAKTNKQFKKTGKISIKTKLKWKLENIYLKWIKKIKLVLNDVLIRGGKGRMEYELEIQSKHGCSYIYFDTVKMKHGTLYLYSNLDLHYHAEVEDLSFNYDYDLFFEDKCMFQTSDDSFIKQFKKLTYKNVLQVKIYPFRFIEFNTHHLHQLKPITCLQCNFSRNVFVGIYAFTDRYLFKCPKCQSKLYEYPPFKKETDVFEICLSDEKGNPINITTKEEWNTVLEENKKE